MAKQVRPFTITGCYDNICFYKMEGVYYARMKSTLRGKEKEKGLFRTMTAQAIQLLKEGKTKEEVLVLLRPATKVKLTTTVSRKKIIKQYFLFAEEILYRVFSSSPVSNETGIGTCFTTGSP